MTTETLPPPTARKMRVAKPPQNMFDQGYRVGFAGSRRLTVINPSGTEYEVDLLLRRCQCIAFGRNLTCKHLDYAIELVGEQIADYRFRLKRMYDQTTYLGRISGKLIAAFDETFRIARHAAFVDNACNALENLHENEVTGRVNGEGLCDFVGAVPYVPPIFDWEV